MSKKSLICIDGVSPLLGPEPSIPTPTGFPPVTIGSRWKHTNGIPYVVYDITNVTSKNPNYPVMVSYRGENGNRWSRRLDDWYRSMVPVSAKDEGLNDLI
jgi:hypothetical protein